MSQMLDVRAGRWAASLLAALDIPNGLLPGLRPAGARAGGLLRSVADLTGFAAGTPVHIGGGDTHMSALSAAAGDGIPVVVAGTTAPVVLPVPTARLAGDPDAARRGVEGGSPPLGQTPFAELAARRGVEGGSSPLGQTPFPLLVSGHVVAGQHVLETNAGATGSIAMRLEDLAGQSGDSLRQALASRGFALECAQDEPLTVLAGHPFFGPGGWASSPPPTVIGLRDSSRGQDLYQACLHGICLAIRATLGCLLRQSGAIAPFIVATGGMSRSSSWTQLLADVTGIQVRVRPLDQISGRAGAVVVTGETLPGRPADEEETCVHEPHADALPVHDAGLARYQQLYRRAQAGARRAAGDPGGAADTTGGQVSRAGAR